MSQHHSLLLPLSRRRFVTGMAGVAVLGAGWKQSAWSMDGTGSAALTGDSIDLAIDTTSVNFTGAARTAVAVNGRVPAPLIRLRQGDTVTLRVANRLRETSSIHWHGLIVPADMDGVPGVSFPGIAPGGSYAYNFKVNQYGTYWYHSHSRFQEQVGLYGPLIIDRNGGERHGSDREHVVLLSDWTDYDPEHIFATLKRQSDTFNFGKRTVGDLLSDVRRLGLAATLEDRAMWGRMRMDPTDLADVGGAVYTYLMNGVTPERNWVGLFSRGERVRLRFINASSMSFFDIRIPGLKLTVVAADGQDVEPVSVDEFRLAAAETLDVIVAPQDDRPYTIFAAAMDRSGYARGTLAPRAGMEAAVPELESRTLLTMQDMGMAHGSHAAPASGAGAAAHNAHAGHDAAVPDKRLIHAPAEYGPGVDSMADKVSARLDDPGPGLRENGRRVLTYADLHTLGGPIDRRDPEREIELHLTGHMERFMWSFSGRKFSEAEPLRFRHGERLMITLVNDSMMAHPIHLHGMWSEVIAEDSSFQVRKHTVSVHPAQKISYLVTADALGRWAYHCHLLYHMEAGMFREVIVSHGEGSASSGGLGKHGGNSS
jgi:CopA family copper-resistance protein